MTKQDFLSSIPHVVTYSESGKGYLEILSDTIELKGAGYRHQDKLCSGSAFGPTWSDVYSKMSEWIRQQQLK